MKKVKKNTHTHKTRGLGSEKEKDFANLFSLFFNPMNGWMEK